MITLWPFQSDLIRCVGDEFRAGYRSVLMVSETGSGKTPMAASVCQTIDGAGQSLWFLVPRRELLQQASRTFTEFGIEHGVIAAGMEHSSRPIQIATVDTVHSRLDALLADCDGPDWLVNDEAHHDVCVTRSEIRQRIPRARILGLTATAARGDGRGLGEVYQRMVVGPPMAELIAGGYLSPYKYYAPTDVDMDGVGRKGGDYIASEAAERVTRAIVGSAVLHYWQYACGQSALVFCPNIEHSKATAEQFFASGIPAAHVDGKTPTAQRDATLKEFAAGVVRVLCSVDLFIEGLNCPAASCCIILRPTDSRNVQRQAVGRVLRYLPGKTAIILDCVGNWTRHGLPDWEQQWSLDAAPGAARMSDEALLSLRQCATCGGAYEAGPISCPYCGSVAEIKPLKVLYREGELEQVQIDAAAAQIAAEALVQQQANVAKWKAGAYKAWAIHPKERQAYLLNLCRECGYQRGRAFVQLKLMQRKRGW